MAAHKKTSPKPLTQKQRYLRLREQLENMREVHALMLVTMVVLVAALFMVAHKQQQRIESLEFKVDFLDGRYQQQKSMYWQKFESELKPDQP